MAAIRKNSGDERIKAWIDRFNRASVAGAVSLVNPPAAEKQMQEILAELRRTRRLSRSFHTPDGETFRILEVKGANHYARRAALDAAKRGDIQICGSSSPGRRLRQPK